MEQLDLGVTFVYMILYFLQFLQEDCLQLPKIWGSQS